MRKITLQDVIDTLPKINKGLVKYKSIMSKIYSLDVSTNIEFQKEYNGFFRMRQRPGIFYFEYFKYMESIKNNNSLSFAQILTHFYSIFNRVEASFSSKLLSVINPEMPVWDEFVLFNLNLRKPQSNCKDKTAKTIGLYSDIYNWYKAFIITDEAGEWIERFDNFYPNSGLTNTKKIDLILWQTR